MHDNKTVVRGGYGIFWLPGGLETSGTSTNNPIATIGTPFVSSLDGGVTPKDRLSNPFPNGLIALIDASQGTNALIGQGLTGFIRGEHQGYVQQWNFDIQREIANGFAVDVAYAGSHGIGLPGTIALNQLPDEFLKLGTSLTQQVANPFVGLVTVGTLSQPTVALRLRRQRSPRTAH